MGRGQARSFEEADKLAQHKVWRKCVVFKYIRVDEDLRNCGTKMINCVFCGHKFQRTQFVVARHFKQGKGCPQVTEEALVDIHYCTTYKMVDKQLERLHHYKELQGGAPAVAADGVAGGDGKSGVAVEEDEVQEVDDMIDAKGDAVQQEVEEPYTQRLGKAMVGESSRKRKEREGGGNVAQRKKMRQHAIKDVLASQWLMYHKKKFPPFVYNQQIAFTIFGNDAWNEYKRHFVDLSGPIKVLWPHHNEIVAVKSMRQTADDVAADLKDAREPFYVTSVPILSDGRKSHDHRPVVNFLATASRDVLMIRMVNKEGSRDDRPSVLERWVDVFERFGPKLVNAICTDSAAAYTVTANALAHPKMRPQCIRITWIPCVVHVCNKLLSDIGTVSTWINDTILRAGAVVWFIKMHGDTFHLFRLDNKHMSLTYPYETRSTSVFAMLEHLIAVRQALKRTVNTAGWSLVSWDARVERLARWVRWKVRHGRWWDMIETLVRIMDPVYDLLRWLDLGGMHMSLVVPGTLQLQIDMARELRVLPIVVAKRTFRRCSAVSDDVGANTRRNFPVMPCPSRYEVF
ncbi:hypothetical protein CBR_g44306 [Chara braunii]|uniref:DUF659 domain-containing protein n=1 Tax=Chara braunii TaxID=69332 RepID=A0A388K2Y6_CHABU|nr:hypothetical protein CBR_g44306 [Chara braunii]|eukprot:GBG64421.1 hypothetical protein CBR_g44306 [Chara braunii]